MENQSNSTINKKQISEDLIRYRDNRAGGSTNQASKQLDISVATASNMINGKWDGISDQMWRKVMKQVNNPVTKSWSIVNTEVISTCHAFFDDSRENSECYGIIGPEGCGKDVAIETYAASHKNFYYVNCAKYWNQIIFFKEVLKAMGAGDGSLTAHEMMGMIKEKALKEDLPVLVLNEADKLSDSVLLSFVTFFNELEDEVGLIIIATQHLKRRIIRGVRTDKMGFRELYSRIGRKFIELPSPSKKDVELICHANGIKDRLEINKIYNEDPTVTDIRRIRKAIRKERKKQEGAPLPQYV